MTDADKILKWVGFELAHAEGDESVKAWVKDGHAILVGAPLNMNFFFKYVVPKLHELNYGYNLTDIRYKDRSWGSVVELIPYMGAGKDIEEVNIDPEKAWQGALIKLIGD